MPLFLADAMLKKLCRWLRIFGIPCLYAGDFTQEDDEIIRLAVKKKAVLLTTDKLLHRKASDYAKTLLVETQDTKKQLVQVVKAFGIPIKSDFPSKTLCPQCNGRLKTVGKKAVEGKVLASIARRRNKFWLCANRKCGKIYWEGTHWKKIALVAKAVCNRIK